MEEFECDWPDCSSWFALRQFLEVLAARTVPTLPEFEVAGCCNLQTRCDPHLNLLNLQAEELSTLSNFLGADGTHPWYFVYTPTTPGITVPSAELLLTAMEWNAGSGPLDAEMVFGRIDKAGYEPTPGTWDLLYETIKRVGILDSALVLSPCPIGFILIRLLLTKPELVNRLVDVRDPLTPSQFLISIRRFQINSASDGQSRCLFGYDVDALLQAQSSVFRLPPAQFWDLSVCLTEDPTYRSFSEDKLDLCSRAKALLFMLLEYNRALIFRHLLCTYPNRSETVIELGFRDAAPRYPGEICHLIAPEPCLATEDIL
eukprot:Protomagalhaensia_wolfi_Nauph_80__6140@NODE_893_length_1905_cov_189_105038_g672_i0_p1_GENE_NODE_893_length_1905_cov_189_105038_g672_i0NODE_893_length_1905_cov_189_105038_g672_i0_p1_ORF_typecomplete_len316_score31_92_NODE_893_length_1905_cov_189_105038_g672_i03071254